MRDRLSGWHAAFLAALALLFLAAFAVGYIRSPRRALQLPPRSSTPGIARAVSGAIQQADSSSLTIATPNGAATFSLSSSSQIESLRAAKLEDFQAGDLVNVGAVRHDQTIYSITGIVDIPASLARKGP
jgi:hypothetical protein